MATKKEILEYMNREWAEKGAIPKPDVVSSYFGINEKEYGVIMATTSVKKPFKSVKFRKPKIGAKRRSKPNSDRLLEKSLRLKDKQIKVINGNKIPIGSTGTCFWVGQGQFEDVRIGFRDAEGNTYFTSASNVIQNDQLEVTPRLNREEVYVSVGRDKDGFHKFIKKF